VSARVAPEQHRIRLTLHYDGGGFAGWQLQPAERTVQGELEAALARLTTVPVRVIAAGRTDRGVHATGQVVGALVPRKWEPAPLRRALNAVLPSDVWVSAAEQVNDSFHARYDAVARGYVYRLGTAAVSRSPFFRRWCWPLARPIPLAELAGAAARFQGDHSFRAFAKAGQPERGERCTVYAAEWREWAAAGLAFRVVANRFLHHMVRYMVGTMVEVALGRRDAGEIDRLLAGESGLETSPPAPPEGLYLTRVYYQDDNWSDEDAVNEILS
jgi:tRNA pseudouridine38-40 synthase